MTINILASRYQNWPVMISGLLARWRVHPVFLAGPLSKDTYSWSTCSFQTIIYSGTFISFLSLSSILFFFHCPHIFIFIFTVCAGYLYVTDTLSTPTITEPPSVECQDLLIPCQIEFNEIAQNVSSFNQIFQVETLASLSK